MLGQCSTTTSLGKGAAGLLFCKGEPTAGVQSCRAPRAGRRVDGDTGTSWRTRPKLFSPVFI